MDGSSPRVWGTYIKTDGKIAIGRFIPTRVGNMAQFLEGKRKIAVHPHACGEHDPEAIKARFEHRFIPTRVGNIKTLSKAVLYPSVHPHACGEH